MKETVDPTTEDAGMSGTRYKHPAYGQISVNRISGTRALFDSDFKHHGFVRVTIVPADLYRNLSGDMVYGSLQPHIVVDMSEAQWATFVSSFGTTGTPCTIDQIGREPVPDLPVRDSAEHFRPEFNERVDRAVSSLDALIETLSDGTSGLSKKKADALLARAQSARQDVAQNLQFVSDQFGKHMEDRVEKGKAELNAYRMRTIHDAGIAALTAGVEVSMIEDKRERDDAA